MTENERVMEQVLQLRQMGIKSAIATVVKVYGSAYRREGAKMLIDEYENRTGMISGGCLEADVAEAAKEVISTGQPVLKTYHLDEEVVWGLGLGCPGTVKIHIELVSSSE
ncbi:XdhC family protein [Siminovitchia sp. FSL H7-0308]|uniref:Xanthine/CO dehydrogenase XdhC/CoxF family maturation factor n=1 Tax=Siminovitchia thermophila TaxID=1245522 RepID=A0ABS2R503_9BACI|nr:XdhC family protein [Siminovitchia thermophila]MBM7714234.1 xanthine/CO dehydrogenase XdhC/CoxF family maturation factor [Siminovitchia thermophila]